MQDYSGEIQTLQVPLHKQGCYTHIIVLVLYFQDIDFGVAHFTISKDRSEVVDFTKPFWQESLTIMVKIPEKNMWLVYVKLFKVTQCNLLLSNVCIKNCIDDVPLVH